MYYNSYMINHLPKITIRAPTVDEEFGQLKNVLNRLSFYKKSGYVVELPDISLLQDSKILLDLDNAFSVFKTSEYDLSFFSKGLKKLNFERNTIEKLARKLIKIRNFWDFKVFSEYEILLTKYGPGGRYNPNIGRVILLTTKDGGFKRESPHTILHEITHIGIEDSIVKKYTLSHSEKERLVDLLVKIIFNKEFPNYWVQKIGDGKMDSYINSETIKNLPETIKRYVTDFPR